MDTPILPRNDSPKAMRGLLKLLNTKAWWKSGHLARYYLKWGGPGTDSNNG